MKLLQNPTVISSATVCNLRASLVEFPPSRKHFLTSVWVFLIPLQFWYKCLPLLLTSIFQKITQLSVFFAALLFGQQFENPSRSPRHVGCIDPACDLRSVVLDAYENAKFLCDQYYLASPEVQIHEHNGWYNFWSQRNREKILNNNVKVEFVNCFLLRYRKLFIEGEAW